MKLLEERILKDGKVYPGNVLKVGSFLNHKIDIELLLAMGEEVKRLFEGEEISVILTVEASGIAIATAFAAVLKVPVVFAKKHSTSNISKDVYSAEVYSYTHNVTNNIVIEKSLIAPDDKVLIVDDFLANGAAMNGLIDIVSQAGATLTGCVAAVEKCFQDGGKKLREKGIRVESLAMVESMSDDSLVFRT